MAQLVYDKVYGVVVFVHVLTFFVRHDVTKRESNETFYLSILNTPELRQNVDG